MKDVKAIVCTMLAVVLLSQSASAWFTNIGSKPSGYWTEWQLGVVSNTAGSVTCEYHRYWIDNKTGRQEKEEVTRTNAVYNFFTRSYKCKAPR